jgi:hypothetical protein
MNFSHDSVVGPPVATPESPKRTKSITSPVSSPNTPNSPNRKSIPRTPLSGHSVITISDRSSARYYSLEETKAFTTHINNSFPNDELLAKYLPMDVNSEDLFQKLQDGLILMKLVNLIVPGTIPEKSMNKKDPLSIFQKQENLNQVISGAASVGCQIVNIGGQDIIAGKPTLILGILWQLIKLQLLRHVTLDAHPEVSVLREPG